MESLGVISRRRTNRWLWYGGGCLNLREHDTTSGQCAVRNTSCPAANARHAHRSTIFHQVGCEQRILILLPLTKELALYTTFMKPFGRYHFNCLPFGISLGPEHFQNMMVTEVTAGLEGVVCHMDDVLVWGATKDPARTEAVLERTVKAGITLNMSNISLEREDKFHGNIIWADSMEPGPNKTRAAQDIKKPTNRSQLRSFLGMVNQFGEFLRNLAEKDKALWDLLSEKKSVAWVMINRGPSSVWNRSSLLHQSSWCKTLTIRWKYQSTSHPIDKMQWCSRRTERFGYQ